MNGDFKEKLKHDIIKKLKTKNPAYGGKENKDKVDIACIHFGYDNGKVIEMLFQRGANLANGEFEKVEENEKVICDMIEENYR